MFYIIVIIILVAILYDADQKNKELTKRVNQLEKQLKEKRENDENVETLNYIQNKEESLSHVQNTVDSSTINKIQKVQVQTKKYNSEDAKNNAILITGSIFIVLAAIIFLTSTWRIIPSVIKTTVLIALVGVFLGASSIAKKVFNLKQTSKAFYFIAMAYIPICLASISIFGLIGNYLSISGEGKYIYLYLASIVLSLIYYTEYYRNKYKSMYILNLIAQVFSVLFGMLILNATAIYTCIAILIYNILLVFVAKDKVTNILSKILVISVGTLSIFIDLANGISWAMVVALLAIITTMVIYGKREKYNKETYTGISLFLIIITGYIVLINLNLKYFAYVIYALSIFAFSFTNVLKEKNIVSELKVIGCLSITITYLYLLVFKYTEFINNVLLFALSLGILLFAFIKENDKDFKILFKIYSVIMLYILMFSLTYLLDIKELRIYIPTIVTLLLMFIEVACEKIRGISTNILLSISESISFITLCFVNKIIALPIMIVFSLCILVINNFITKKHQAFDIIPLMGLLIKIINVNIDIIPNELILGVISLFTLGVSIYKVKLNMYTGISALYLLSAFTYINNVYINCIFFILWNVMNWIMIEEIKAKDIFKFLALSGIVYLYIHTVGDLNIEYNSIKYIILPIYAIVIFRTILNKYIKDISPLEVCLLSIIFLYALIKYTSEVDGMIFSLGIISLIIYGYNQKIGTIFLTSLVAIIINVFVLTREFWISIPWWLYMLTIGIILISFAIYNEKNKNNNKELIKKVKEKLMLK